MAADDKVKYSLRMDRELYEQIQTLSKLKRSPISKILLTAIEEHAQKQTFAVQQQLVDDLATLQKYVQDDPTFERAIAKIAVAEATGGSDATEGHMYLKQSARLESAGEKSNQADAEVLEGFLENA
ncbi:MAG: hypothetical protein Fues2KO_02180 [Fuerstiella sp.]